MKKITILLLTLSIQFVFSTEGEWSKTGHRTTGEVAQRHLNKKAKKAIAKLLDGQSLALVSTFADDIKSDKKYREFSAWHYVNYPADKKYTEVEPSPYGDIVSGIQKCVAIVKDKNSTQEDKVFYLKFLVHLLGDLHQPMHVGKQEDKGGNDIQVQWFGKGSNLHRLWDSNMIDDYGMSFTEIADNLPELTKDEVKGIQEGDVFTWVEESKGLATELYGSVEVGEKLGYAYSYKYWGLVETQLQKGGLRLAKVLNELFK
ncbi:S1/P1 nuclease [Cellulophaga algicola DSM 14237]|uniref:S1/P1 nuclease n=1 Tax=Cellulophaga algicola (strain DSM 14237 / IC166 / ACAM 630) TaxID=688270 RepID=E6X865_CELAD|nr:S1/P1 nuclease [Cellulophaga algicola]ADV49691.1 S1/P1 nuclease [Cellulophaga algicola DSM 14237]